MISTPDETRAQALNDQGLAYLREGDPDTAAACFKEAWKLGALPPALNNLATIHFENGKPTEALQELQPLLEVESPLPYTHALASLCHSALEQPDAARRHLSRAIRDFDRGWHQLRRTVGDDPAWTEYTVIIKRAAGYLGEHRLLLELHSRWPGSAHPVGAFWAGVAHFNLGKFNRAARAWDRVQDRNLGPTAEAFGEVASLVDRGVVPPFPLEYDLLRSEPEGEMTEEVSTNMLKRGAVRMPYLYHLFQSPENSEQAVNMTLELIHRTGEWGVTLGQSLLKASGAPMTLKMGAARALTELGHFAQGEPIPIIHQGRPTEIRLQRMEVTHEMVPEHDQATTAARNLWEKGRRLEALERLTALHDQGIAYPPAMLLEAHVLHTMGERDAARTLLQALEEISPNQPVVLLQISLISLETGDIEQARAYLDRIDASRLPPGFQQDLAQLRTTVETATLMANELSPAALIFDGWREEVEEKPISLDVTVAKALKQIPVQWLNAAAGYYNLAPQRRRPEREKGLAAALQDPVRLQQALSQEAREVRSALAFLLAEGGWAKLQRLTHRYGTMEGDGFYWDEHPPASTLGRLRLLGLLYVGRAKVGGRSFQVGVVPTDLRPVLAKALEE